MYANLKVHVTTPEGEKVTHSAWKVKTTKTGRVRVYLDDDNGPDWNYANPAGRKDYPAGTRVTVTADF